MTVALGRLVAARVRSAHTSRVLEIGTRCGRCSLQIARALPPEGMLITIEREAATASVARRLFARHGCADQVSLIVGDPARYLHKISGPFEIVVQTGAEPTRFAVLHERLIALLKPGGALITYNLARAADYNEKLIADPRLETVNADLNLGAAISWLRRP